MGYVAMSGTSMASPNVVGVAALIMASDPGHQFTPAEVLGRLQSTAQDTGAVGRDDLYGAGIVSAYAAVLGPDALCTVTYHLGDGSDPVESKVACGRYALAPDSPQQSGHAFAGWSTVQDDSALASQFVFSGAVNHDVDLYAQWAAAQPGMYVTEFPDLAFRNWVLRLLNQDGGNRADASLVSQSDKDALALVDELDLAAKGIADFTGLQYFTGATILDCRGNSLSELDVSQNTALKSLYCGDNYLTSIDVSHNVDLVDLYVDFNQLDQLEVADNLQLASLDVVGNQLTGLDVSHNTQLVSLWFDDNEIDSIDVTHNPDLEVLTGDFNPISSVDVTANASLTWLDMSETTLTSINLTHNPVLDEFDCFDCLLTTLDTSENPKLRVLAVDGNQLTSLDVTQNPALEWLWAANNQIATLDTSGNPVLFDVSIDSNRLTSLDFRNNPELEALWAGNNQLQSIDLSNNQALESLTLYTNELTSLDVSSSPLLDTLWVGYNQLSALDVSLNTILTNIDVDHNELLAFDLSNNPLLYWVACGWNQLTSLDVSNNTKLETLTCSNNMLTSLNVSQTVLTWLDVTYNHMNITDDVTGWEQLDLALDDTFMFYGEAVLEYADINYTDAVVAQGDIALTLSVDTYVDPDVALKYQWYLITSDDSDGGTAVDGAVDSTFDVPASLTPGIYDYYCLVESAYGQNIVNRIVSGTAEITVNAAAESDPVLLSGIDVTSGPLKTSYTAGETLDLTGLVITAGYDDGSTQEATGYTTDPEAGYVLPVGDTVVTVSFTQDGVTQTTSFTVSAVAAESDPVVLSGIGVTTTPTKTS